MESAAREFLFRLLKTPSPSGYEQPIQALVREYLERCADTVTTDSHGNVIGAKNASAPTRMLLAGHCDQIGLIVQYIDADGFISVQPIGGWDPIQLVGARVTIWTKNGPVTGVMSRKPIHLLTEEERKQVPKMKDLWIDIGAENKADCESVVRVGDPITLELEVRQLRRDLCCSVAMDDKVGLWVVLEAFRRAVAAGPLPCGLFVASTVQEEIGLRGAQTSCHGVDPHVVDRLLAASQAKEIPIQLAASGRATPTDANALQVTRSGVATGLVSVPNRYMHSAVEMVSLEDADRTADLLAAFCRGLEGEIDWAPV